MHLETEYLGQCSGPEWALGPWPAAEDRVCRLVPLQLPSAQRTHHIRPYGENCLKITPNNVTASGYFAHHVRPY